MGIFVVVCVSRDSGKTRRRMRIPSRKEAEADEAGHSHQMSDATIYLGRRRAIWCHCVPSGGTLAPIKRKALIRPHQAQNFG